MSTAYLNKFSLFIAILALTMQLQAAPNVRLYGSLVAEPCVIPQGEENLSLDFGSIVDKNLYLNSRTPSQTFEIHLAECDLSLGSLVKISFGGTESLALPGKLGIDAGSTASGIAIGLEATDGKEFIINDMGSRIPLQSGNNIVSLRAYVQGEPEALINHNIIYGAFTASTTFTLEYE